MNEKSKGVFYSIRGLYRVSIVNFATVEIMSRRFAKSFQCTSTHPKKKNVYKGRQSATIGSPILEVKPCGFMPEPARQNMNVGMKRIPWDNLIPYDHYREKT
jgi:hypothetical protein